MKTREKIYKELFASQRVEFNLLEDVRKMSSNAQNSEDKAVQQVQQGLSALNKAKSAFDLAIKDAQNVLDAINKAKQSAKSLGVELPANAISSEKYFNDSIVSFRKFINEISKVDSTLNSIK